MRALSVVIPALNEEENIARVLSSVPVRQLHREGWATQVVVVDNASTDRTGELARALGAAVVQEPNRGYGNAYKAGFRHATGDVIATGDADLTYPLDRLPELLAEMDRHRAEFMTTNRLLRANSAAMKPSHAVGNQVLSAVSRALFRNGFRDSQSGMWLFKRSIWPHLDVRSGGMAFSQEIKNEAHRQGLRCHETPIEYRPRGGTVKLNALSDGWGNLRQLLQHRARPVVVHQQSPTTAPVTPPTLIDLRMPGAPEVLTTLDD